MRNLFGKTVVELLGATEKLTDQQSEALGQEFVRQERLMHHLVKKHIHRYGGDYDALFSRAIDTLFVAWLKHDPARSAWQKYIYNKLVRGLLDLYLETVRRKHAEYTNLEEQLLLLPARPEFNINEIMEDIDISLTPDAQLYLKHTQQDTKSRNRRSMYGKFRDEMLAKGWSGKRIIAAAQEVCDILTWSIQTEDE